MLFIISWKESLRVCWQRGSCGYSEQVHLNVIFPSSVSRLPCFRNFSPNPRLSVFNDEHLSHGDEGEVTPASHCL